MSSRNYTIAMVNDIHTGAYDPPLRDPSPGGSEWLIVRRWGDFGEFLFATERLMALEVGDLMDASEDDVLARMGFPSEHRAKLHTARPAYEAGNQLQRRR